MQDTADRIRERMNELNIKQADIQRATGAGKATISSWVKGATLPSGEYISKLASVLKSDVNWLLTGNGTMTAQSPAHPKPSIDLPANSPSVVDLITNIKEMEVNGELTPHVVSAINGVIEALKASSPERKATNAQPSGHQIDIATLTDEANKQNG